MHFEHVPIPAEAQEKMSKHMEGLTPVISEEALYEIGEDYPEIAPAVAAFIRYAERYAVDVWNMHKMLEDGALNTEEGVVEYKAADEARTVLHNALVDSVAILSRALAKNDIDNEWVRNLTDDGHTLSRASCGSFALLLVYRRYLDNSGI